MQSIRESRVAFIGAFTAAAFAAGTAATTLGIAPAQAQAQDQLASLPPVNKKTAWETSKEHGGTLVIWYDARHQWDADGLVAALKQRGTQNVVALPGRTDGMFQLMAGGKIDKKLYDLEDARNGILGASAVDFISQRKIALMEFEDGAPYIVHELDRRLA